MDAAPSSSDTSFSGSGNFSAVEFIQLAIMVCAWSNMGPSSMSYECVCVCVAIWMRIFQCFSSINKTAAINLNLGRRFHAKQSLAFAAALVRASEQAHATDEVKFEI